MERFLPSENRVRLICAQCGEVAYCNPKILVTTIVAWGHRVLLCRRAGPPAQGRWALPGGFVETGETMEEAAARETLEETGVQLAPHELRLYGVAMLPYLGELYVGFLAAVSGDTGLVSGSECSEVGFFGETDLPWTELAYADIGAYLREYFVERRSGAHVFHYGCIENSRVVSKVYRIADVADDFRWRIPPTSN